jgi:hypothetical protein
MISSLGVGELLRLSPALETVVLDANPLASISSDAFMGLPNLISLSMTDCPSTCAIMPNLSIFVVNCTCAPDYANDPRWPSYCGQHLNFCVSVSSQLILCFSE